MPGSFLQIFHTFLRGPLGFVIVGDPPLCQVVTFYLTPVVYSYLAEVQECPYNRGAKEHEIMGIS